MPERKTSGTAYTLGFAAAVCVVCSVLLAAATAGLKARQDAAAELDRRMNVLKVFGAPIRDAQGRAISAAEAERLYDTHVRETRIDPTTRQPAKDDRPDALPLYTWVEDGVVKRYAIPISGKGLWSTIYGYLAIEPDLATIAGITFYKDGETPGLGGEIGSDWFQAQFKGKRFFQDGRLTPLIVAKGPSAGRYPAAEQNRVVDGISGATMTGRGVQTFLNDDLRRYEPYFATRRET